MHHPLLAALALLLLAAPATALSVSVTRIAFIGDAVPGGTFTGIGSGRGGATGGVALTARVAGGSQGVWTWNLAAGGTPTPLVVPGPSPVGPAGSEISSAFPREITASGRVGYEATLRSGPGGVTS